MKKDVLPKLLLFVIMVMILLISGCTTPSSPSQTEQKQTQLVTPTIETPAPTRGTMSMMISSTATPVSTPAPLKDTPALNTIRVEESNLSVFTFSPGWRYREVPAASGGSFAVTNYGAYGFNDIKVDIKFSGTGIALVYRTMSFGGIADVMIDGKKYSSIDMYSNIEKAVTSIIATDLENSQHVLTISPAANYNPSVTFTPEVKQAIITVDAVEIIRPV